MNVAINKKEIRKLYSGLKASATKRGIPFTLTFSDLNELSFPITCPVFNIPLHFHTGKSQDDSFSVDRVDSSKGYHADNIIVISNRANKLKSDSTLEEMKQLVDFYEQYE